MAPAHALGAGCQPHPIPMLVAPNAWPLAGTIVPIADIAWSLWLIALGVALLVT
jgi:hypothetical protein